MTTPRVEVDPAVKNILLEVALKRITPDEAIAVWPPEPQAVRESADLCHRLARGTWNYAQALNTIEERTRVNATYEAARQRARLLSIGTFVATVGVGALGVAVGVNHPGALAVGFVVFLAVFITLQFVVLPGLYDRCDREVVEIYGEHLRLHEELSDPETEATLARLRAAHEPQTATSKETDDE